MGHVGKNTTAGMYVINGHVLNVKIVENKWKGDENCGIRSISWIFISVSITRVVTKVKDSILNAKVIFFVKKTHV